MTMQIADYLAKIPPLHAGKPKFIAVLSLLLQPYADAQAFLAGLPQAFDVDYAIGAQLDVVGEWVGVSRNIPIPIASPWFAWDSAVHGWDRAPWQVLGVSAGSTYQSLDDDTFRRLIKAKIAANSWDGTAASAQTILQGFITFPGAFIFVEDKGDMNMVVGVSGALPPIIDLEIIGQGLIPLKPPGVGLDVRVTSIAGAPLFGFDVSSAMVSGWDVGAWDVSADYAAENLS